MRGKLPVREEVDINAGLVDAPSGPEHEQRQVKKRREKRDSAEAILDRLHDLIADDGSYILKTTSINRDTMDLANEDVNGFKYTLSPEMVRYLDRKMPDTRPGDARTVQQVRDWLSDRRLTVKKKLALCIGLLPMGDKKHRVIAFDYAIRSWDCARIGRTYGIQQRTGWNRLVAALVMLEEMLLSARAYVSLVSVS
jgi:hypothetical protein